MISKKDSNTVLKRIADDAFSHTGIVAIVRSVAPSVDTKKTLQSLIDSGEVVAVSLPGPGRPRTMYARKHVALEYIALAAHPHSYICNETAASLHGLIPSNPTRIYVNVEQRQSSPALASISQASIDAAFRRAPRITSNRTLAGDVELILLNGKNTDCLEVIDSNLKRGTKNYAIRLTSLERTLIDLTTSPHYAGGVQIVSRAFQSALSRINIVKLAKVLETIRHVYPYRQAIGYYLDRTGAFDSSDLSPLRNPPFENDFYLMKNMPCAVYISDWRIFVPEDLEANHGKK